MPIQSVTNFEEIFNTNNDLSQHKHIVMAIVGSSSAGKTTLLKHILGKAKCYTHRFLVTGTPIESDNNYLQHFYPDDIYHVDIKDNIEIGNIRIKIENFTKEVLTINEEIKDKMLVDKNSKINKPKILFVFDDLGNLMKDFARIVNTIRHSRINFIFLIHNDIDMPPTLRSNITHYIVSFNHNISQMKDTIFKKNKDAYLLFSKEIKDLSKKISESKKEKGFVFIDMEDINNMSYKILSEEEFKELSNDNSIFEHSSITRYILKSLLKTLAANIKKKDSK